MDLEPLLALSESAARRAAELLLERWCRSPQGVDTKSSPTDLVSDADRDSERLLIDVIHRERPDDGVVAEETGARSSRSGLSWILDPLDGTVNYLFRIPVWAISIAVADDRQTLVGVVYDPNRDELFSATRGGGATINGAPMHVSDVDDIATALIGTGFAYDSRARQVQAETLQRVLPRVRDIRRAGSAALDLASVACGRLDGLYEAPMERWDRAAGALLVEEAGGVVSELEGPLQLSSGVVAAGASLHDRLRALVLDDG
ncbi:MAG: inositol monophosphatase family protein [Actinomycetota bacterium]